MKRITALLAIGLLLSLPALAQRYTLKSDREMTAIGTPDAAAFLKGSDTLREKTAAVLFLDALTQDSVVWNSYADVSPSAKRFVRFQSDAGRVRLTVFHECCRWDILWSPEENAVDVTTDIQGYAWTEEAVSAELPKAIAISDDGFTREMIALLQNALEQ